MHISFSCIYDSTPNGHHIARTKSRAQMLSHKNINNTLLYSQIINFENDDYYCRTAKTLREDQELIEAGFEYVAEREGTEIYRKPK